MNTVNSKNYVELAISTESRDLEAITDRLSSKFILQFLYLTIVHVVEWGDMLDQYKKFLFYGKPLTFDIENPILSPDINQQEVLSRIKSPEVIRLFHAALGLCTESIELIDGLRSHIFEGSPLNKVNLREEGGDILWYIAVLVDTLNISLDELLTTNIGKLSKRYKGKFSSEMALGRDINSELSVFKDIWSIDTLGPNDKFRYKDKYYIVLGVDKDTPRKSPRGLRQVLDLSTGILVEFDPRTNVTELKISLPELIKKLEVGTNNEVPS